MNQKQQLEENYKAAIALLNIREEQIGELLSEGAAEQSMHLTALRRGLAASIFINVILLAVVLFTIGGR